MINVDKNIPIPERKCKAIRKYPINEMEIGDSFLVSTENEYKAASTSMRKAGFKPLVRKDGVGYRIWRIE
jgi:hypothetical protein